MGTLDTIINRYVWVIVFIMVFIILLMCICKFCKYTKFCLRKPRRRSKTIGFSSCEIKAGGKSIKKSKSSGFFNRRGS